MQTAWFDPQHPAVRVTCPACDASAGKACVTMDARGNPVVITGLHAERVALVKEKRK
jgi:hypothetical protein